MVEFEHGDPALGRIHKRNNDKKFFCHFTGFLEGIAASGYIELGEVEPLLVECAEFVRHASDRDAYDIIQDFEADILEHEMIADAVEIRRAEIDTECEKSKVNWFLGFCRGIISDGRITEKEAQCLLDILEANVELLGVIGVKQVQITCSDAIQDGIVSEEESNEICEAIGFIVGDSYGDTGVAQTQGTANFEEFRLQDINVDLEEKNVVLSGNFKCMPRSKFAELLEEYGAQISKHVSGKTDYIIIGGEASRDWIELNRGTKIRKAQQLRLKNRKPHFISESQLLRLLP